MNKGKNRQDCDGRPESGMPNTKQMCQDAHPPTKISAFILSNHTEPSNFLKPGIYGKQLGEALPHGLVSTTTAPSFTAMPYFVLE